jgi:GT2 family glycosyltransferase
MEEEGLSGSDVILVVNGEGGLDDRGLEAAVRVLRLGQNIGPAGGFARGLRFAVEVSDTPWIYACEDDAVLEGFATPRLSDLVERAEAHERRVPRLPAGVVGTLGWDIDSKTGRTSRHIVAAPDGEVSLEQVDFVGWGGYALVSRKVIDAGILPDEKLFWWAEDLDFCLRVRQAGFRVLVDRAARPKVSAQCRSARAFRPGRAEEPWCSYYMARNGFVVSRRFGDARWTARHLLKSVRRFQLAPSFAHRTAIMRGLADGFMGRTGKHPAFVRRVGEW